MNHYSSFVRLNTMFYDRLNRLEMSATLIDAMVKIPLLGYMVSSDPMYQVCGSHA